MKGLNEADSEKSRKGTKPTIFIDDANAKKKDKHKASGLISSDESGRRKKGGRRSKARRRPKDAEEEGDDGAASKLDKPPRGRSRMSSLGGGAVKKELERTLQAIKELQENQ